MPRWRNWSGKLEGRPSHLHLLRSEADARGLVRQATRSGAKIRVAGATHSHAPLVLNDGGIVADAAGLSGVISMDCDRHTARVWAGSRLFTLGNPLHQGGLAFANQGDIDQQAIAGATATGTHGTGRDLRNFSAAVVGMRIVLASGEVVDVSADESPELWRASRLHLGAFGIVTQLDLQLRPSYRLKERRWDAPLEDILADCEQLIHDNRHFEFFWYPQDDRAAAKTLNETSDPSVYPIAEEGSRCGWSFEVLPSHRAVFHTEMEYSVPADQGIACMRAVQRLLQTQFTDIRWPVEYRTLAADDVWLSTAYKRDVVTISVHQGMDEDDEPYFRACEEIFLAHGGRPHWGKVHYLGGDKLSQMHERWVDWWRVRDEVDPQQTFVNSYLAGLRP
jgi:FAD/FMN-containing dehydrogenase